MTYYSAQSIHADEGMTIPECNVQSFIINNTTEQRNGRNNAISISLLYLQANIDSPSHHCQMQLGFWEADLPKAPQQTRPRLRGVAGGERHGLTVRHRSSTHTQTRQWPHQKRKRGNPSSGALASSLGRASPPVSAEKGQGRGFPAGDRSVVLITSSSEAEVGGRHFCCFGQAAAHATLTFSLRLQLLAFPCCVATRVNLLQCFSAFQIKNR